MNNRKLGERYLVVPGFVIEVIANEENVINNYMLVLNEKNLHNYPVGKTGSWYVGKPLPGQEKPEQI